ncbi:MAG: helix-turn-helix transcriptional regulator [Pseudonocardiaceae bacterium]
MREVAREMHYHRTAISHLEAGRHPASREFWVRADTVLGAKGALITAYEALETARRDTARRENPVGEPPTAPGEGDRVQRREALSLGLAVAVTPDVLGRVLAGAAAEAMEFTQLAGVSTVGQGTLEHLELVVSDLNRVYSKDPPAEQFVVARAYRSRVDELIRGRHTLKELQALYVYAAWLSELLTWLATDLGNLRAARAYALDCYTYADQAGHGELCGWAANAMASIAMYSEHPDRAMRAAMQGVAKVSASHPLAVSLRAHAARAYARVGQREPCETLFVEALRLHERLPARPPCRFDTDTGIIASYAMTAYPASAYIWLGDFDTARTHGEAALAAIESAPLGSREQRSSFAQIILATALVGYGAPDDAAALGSQALTSARVITSGMVTYVRDLDRALVSRYPRRVCAREFHEQYRHVAQRSTVGAGGA